MITQDQIEASVARWYQNHPYVIETKSYADLLEELKRSLLTGSESS